MGMGIQDKVPKPGSSKNVPPRFSKLKKGDANGGKSSWGEDAVWTEVLAAVHKHLPEGYDVYKETVIEKTALRFIDPQYTALNVLRPDGMFFNRETCQWTLVDYTRSSGSTRLDLAKAELQKLTTYGPVKQAWLGRKSVEIFPLALSYNGAIAVDTWRKCMERIGIEEKQQDHVLATAVKAICVGFSSMVDTRYIALTEQHRIGNAHQGPHDHNP